MQALILTGGGVNLLAPLVSSFLLLSFALINLLCAVSALASPTFAPSFRAYSTASALAGTLASAVAMVAALAHSPAAAACLASILLALVAWKRRALVELVGGRLLRDASLGLPPQQLPVDAVEERVERAAAYVHDALAGARPPRGRRPA